MTTAAEMTCRRASTLRWEPSFGVSEDNGFTAFSGAIMVGIVGRVGDGAHDSWFWKNTVIHRQYGFTNAGRVASLKQAKASLKRSWDRFLEQAGLEPCP